MGAGKNGHASGYAYGSSSHKSGGHGSRMASTTNEIERKNSIKLQRKNTIKLQRKKSRSLNSPQARFRRALTSRSLNSPRTGFRRTLTSRWGKRKQKKQKSVDDST